MSRHILAGAILAAMALALPAGAAPLVMGFDDDGKLYLFTCNADRNLCKATLSGLEGWTQCRVLNEDREDDTLPIENGSITDDWLRFGVHVYEFSK